MAYKIKDKYKGLQLTSMSIALDQLLPHQIENLNKDVLNKYFVLEGGNTKKVKKSFKPTKIEEL
jgi:hypothetical protein